MVQRGQIIALPTEIINPANMPVKLASETLVAYPVWIYVGPAETIKLQWQIGRMNSTFNGITERQYGNASQPASAQPAYFSATLPAISLSPLAPGQYDCEIWFRDGFDDLRVIVQNCVRIKEQTDQYILTTTVSPSGSGSITKSPNQSQYIAGTLVVLTAVPATGYYFDHWEGDATGNSASTSVRMDYNRSVKAFFKEQIPEEEYFTVTVVDTPNEGGYVTPEPWYDEYPKYTVVQYIAYANVGWKPDYWLVNGVRYTGWNIYVTITENTTVELHWKRT